MSLNLNQLAYALGVPEARAVLKQSPDDFVVTEQIGFELSGVGEHLWCWVEKQNQNTDWVAAQLANFVGISPKAVGTAGKKDRQARTYQWMSLHLPGKANPDFSKLTLAGVRVLKSVRHDKKLQTGALSGNHFEIGLHDFSGSQGDTEARLQAIKTGFPNYFGEQRFGQDYANLAQASALFSGKLKRPPTALKGLYLSAARSWIFNELLSLRIENNTWQSWVAGDVYQLADSSGCFKAPEAETDALAKAKLLARLAANEIDATGLLTGRGALMSEQAVAGWEQTMMARHPLWQAGLEKAGLKQARRALRVVPQNLTWQWLAPDRLVLSFGLPKGSYATMLLREVCQLLERQ